MPRPQKTVLPSTKADLMARVEKLERANANLRTKNKALTHAYAAKSETLDELWGERPVDVTLVARRS